MESALPQANSISEVVHDEDRWPIRMTRSWRDAGGAIFQQDEVKISARGVLALKQELRENPSRVATTAEAHVLVIDARLRAATR